MTHPSSWPVGCTYAVISYVAKLPEMQCHDLLCLPEEVPACTRRILANPSATIWSVREGTWRGALNAR